MLKQSFSTRIKFSTAFALLMLLGTSAFATIDTTDTLPRAVNNTQFRYGVMDGADKKFDSSGTLVLQSDTNSITFDAKTIASLQADAQNLINVLNQTGHGNYGNELSLGTLKIDAQPDIRYYAPIYAHGITSKFTLAAALPVISYSNHIALNESGSNAAEIHSQVGYINAQTEDAFARMEQGVVGDVNSTLAQKGYKPLVDRDETLLGDLQLLGLYQFYNSHRLSGLSTTTLYLPTGKADDPDDLADLGNYGQLALEEAVLGNYFVNRTLGFAAKAGYKFVAPLNADVRVPVDANDALPDASRKDRVLRDGGDVATISGTAIVNIGERIQLGSAIDLSYKQKDKVYGTNPGWDYSLLERNTEQTAAKLRLGFEYFTTTAYTRGHSKIPFKIAYEFADTFAGKNVLNTMVHEIGLSLFF